MRAHPHLTLAVDCGSTYLKAAMFDRDLNRLAECERPVAYLVNNATEVELDPETLWSSMVSLIRETCERSSAAPSALAKIALASQAQTFLVTDERGSPRSVLYSWLDKRATAEAECLAKRLGQEFHKHCSFAEPYPQLTLTKLLWLTRHRPEVITADSRVHSLPGFLASRLGAPPAVDRNLAAMGGLYSLRTDTWWAEALAGCGLTEQQLPVLVRMGEPVPAAATCPQLDLSSELSFVFAGNDQTAGAFGNDCRTGGMLVTLGTALVVYRHAGDQSGPYHQGGCWGPYPGSGYYELATRDEGCRALDWARDVLLPGASAREFDHCAGQALERGRPTPCFFYPARAGLSDAWQGSGDLCCKALAVLEGITFSLRELIRDELNCGEGPGLISVIGGGSQSGRWLQLLADILDCPVARGEGDSLLGAAAMARPEVETAAEKRVARYQPNRAMVPMYDRRYLAWLRHGTRGGPSLQP